MLHYLNCFFCAVARAKAREEFLKNKDVTDHQAVAQVCVSVLARHFVHMCVDFICRCLAWTSSW